MRLTRAARFYTPCVQRRNVLSEVWPGTACRGEHGGSTRVETRFRRNRYRKTRRKKRAVKYQRAGMLHAQEKRYPESLIQSAMVDREFLGLCAPKKTSASTSDRRVLGQRSSKCSVCHQKQRKDQAPRCFLSNSIFAGTPDPDLHTEHFTAAGAHTQPLELEKPMLWHDTL